MESVLIVTNSRSGGGAERSMNILAQSFQDLGLTVKLVSINSGDYDLLRPNCIDINLNRSVDGGFLHTFKIALRFRALIVKFSPDAILLNCDLPEFLGLLIPRRLKVFVVEHTTVPFFNRRALGFIIRYCHRIRGTFFVGVNTNPRVWPFRKPPIFVIQNSVDPDLVRVNLEPEKSSQVHESRLVFIGRLSEEKAPEFFVEVVRSTRMRGIVFGDGPLRMKIGANPPSSLEMRGYVINPWNEISTNDILLVTSEFEGDGLVVVEGLLNSMPILLRDVVDLRRFRLPDANYATTIEEFSNQILHHLNGRVDLVPPIDVRLKISRDRDPKNLALSWRHAIEEVIN
jgi:glycosyltransferase involved in cell wall biosynthesis